jgi:hypothetical protein
VIFGVERSILQAGILPYNQVAKEGMKCAVCITGRYTKIKE